MVLYTKDNETNSKQFSVEVAYGYERDDDGYVTEDCGTYDSASLEPVYEDIPVILDYIPKVSMLLLVNGKPICEVIYDTSYLKNDAMDNIKYEKDDYNKAEYYGSVDEDDADDYLLSISENDPLLTFYFEDSFEDCEGLPYVFETKDIVEQIKKINNENIISFKTFKE